MKNFENILFIVFFLIGSFNNNNAGGIVYLVLGSDTAIWAGMNTAKHDNYYDIDLYTNPNRNAYAVMDPAFRDQFIDSYGNPLKMTWWMMAGNIFRYATNKNVPVNNIMTLYLMKKYHGNNITINGDELTLHYHTFFWSDYNGDGVYYWNQSKTFLESLEDFNFTLAQFLLEEEVFPVSFRSGWHYMDNDWQHYLDQRVLPYSLHNDYPAKRTYDDEPIDNIFDWSEAPPNWVPYNPSYSNYQIPGNGKGWQVRSAHFSKARVNDYLDSIFAAASNGGNQIACIWGHLPESDFLENIGKIDSVAHAMEVRYPDVTFRYCTAIEAMKLWRIVNDTIPPTITITENQTGDELTFTISSDEEIFQSQPFVAIKNIYNDYRVIETIKISNNEWRTTESFTKSDLVKVGVTACDDFGNQSMQFIEYLPEDRYIDNGDQGYHENSGNWMTSTLNSWGIDSRIAQLNVSDSVSVQWGHTITKSTYYNIFVQVPEINNPADNFKYVFYQNDIPVDTVTFNAPLKSYNWNYLSTLYFNETDEIIVELIADGENQAGKNVAGDVIKISALVKDRELSIDKSEIDLGEITFNDTVIYPLTISNYGINTLRIFGISSLKNSLISNFSYPIDLPKMSSVSLDLKFSIPEIGEFLDSLMILSDDHVNPKLMLPIKANVQDYFIILDNEDSLNYQEFGEWFTSVATAHGETSRYSWLNSTPKAAAVFNTQLKETGLYDIKYIVPSTVNSTDKALYKICIGNIMIDSVYVDQNEGSGAWVSIGTYFLIKDIDINLRILDSGESSVGSVIRTDAVKFQLEQRLSGIQNENEIKDLHSYKLTQNYPNPFNPSTTIKFQIPFSANVKIDVFNLLGEKIRTLVDDFLPGGIHFTIWDGKNQDGILVASGTYFYRIKTDDFSQSKKMVFLR